MPSGIGFFFFSVLVLNIHERKFVSRPPHPHPMPRTWQSLQCCFPFLVWGWGSNPGLHTELGTIPLLSCIFSLVLLTIASSSLCVRPVCSVVNVRTVLPHSIMVFRQYFITSIVFMCQVHPLPSSCLGSFKFVSIKFPVYPLGLGFSLHSGVLAFLCLVSCLLFSPFSIKDIASFCLRVLLCAHISLHRSLARFLWTWLWGPLLLVIVQQTHIDS